MNNTIPISKAGPCSLWSSALHSVLIPSPRPDNLVETHKNFNPRRHRHSAGLIWKRTLGHCLYCDLSEEEASASPVRQRRRFARLESLGLSGVILYEIPAGTVSTGDAPPRRMTLKSVFGDPTDPSQHGMDVEDLLDSINARVIYFPSYACTSFITGQVISAFFQQQPLIRPLPARDGFSVDATAFINSGFTVGANFALGTGESCSSISLSSPDSPIASTSSIPLIKIYPVDEHCFRGCFPVEPRSEASNSFPMLAYQDFCRGCPEDGFENGFEAKINQDLRLRGSDSGEQQLAGPLLGEADSPFSGFDGLIISHPSVLSLVLDDYSEVISDEPTQNDTAEKDEANTSISTLDSGGPRTPPRSSSPALSDFGDASDDIWSDAATAAKLRRSRSQSSVYGNDKHTEFSSNLDTHSALCTPSSITLVVGDESEFLQEPLTPVNANFPGDQDHTPTHVRAPLANSANSPRLQTPVKTKSRNGDGKENIAPLTLRSRRR